MFNQQKGTLDRFLDSRIC